MFTSAYCTFDEIRKSSGAGLVCYHEIQALKKVTNLKLVVGRSCEDSEVNFTNIDLLKWYEFNPFLFDYFAARLIPKEVDILHLSCSPGLAILDSVKPKHYVVNIVAHDLSVSIEEHERYYGIGTYPFKHNTDPYLHELLLKHSENADCVVCPSTAAEKWINNNLKVKKIKVIPHGCNIPNNIMTLPKQFKVGYLGAFGPDKGLIYLMIAWNHFIKDSELIFGGSCGQYIQPLLTNIIRNNPTYRILGWVNDIADFYNQISVYVQPSVTEGFGIEILEAMSYGRPVIVSSGAGGADVVRDGIDGFIVPPRDPQAILDKLNYFKNNPDKVIKMGMESRERAKEFTWDHIEQKYGEFYLEVLR